MQSTPPTALQRVATPRGARLLPRGTFRSSDGVTLTPDSAAKGADGLPTVKRPTRCTTPRASVSTPRPTVATVASSDSGRRTSSGASTPRPGSGVPSRLARPGAGTPRAPLGAAAAALLAVPRLDLSLAASPAEARADGDYDKPWRQNMKAPSTADPGPTPSEARTPQQEAQRAAHKAALASFAERKRAEVAEKLRQEQEARTAVVHRRVAARNDAARRAKEQAGARRAATPSTVATPPSRGPAPKPAALRTPRTLQRGTPPTAGKTASRTPVPRLALGALEASTPVAPKVCVCY